VVTPDERALIISSDGHASAQMRDYRPYLPVRYHEEFDAFCEEYDHKGTRNFEPKTLLMRTDPEVVEDWVTNVLEPGRVRGLWDPQERFVEMRRQGIVAEVLFPDFGLPFQMCSPFVAASLGYERSQEQIEVANRAYNRWLADFCGAAPERLAGLALVSFADVDATVEEIRWAKEAGLRGIVLPEFEEEVPLFDMRFEPVWRALEELEMPAASHLGNSSVTQRIIPIAAMARATNPVCALQMAGPEIIYFCQRVLTHLIWGGVLERHPDLQIVLTEQGSGWVISALEGMDYSYEGSYLRRDFREVVPLKPSGYFDRQCHLGSSLLSLAEVEARHRIGVHKMAIGADYPHHEGTWGAGPGTLEYLRATMGRAHVPPDEARLMLGENAARVWGFDTGVLRPLADRIGPKLDDVLTPPTHDWFPRGDVRKPLASAF
jgi:predicted TIM-barrel fold metal-dependent hydrolase